MVSLKLTLETGVLCQAAKAGKAKQRVRKVKTTRKAIPSWNVHSSHLLFKEIL